MPGRLSIRARLTAAFAAAMVLVLVLAGVFVYERVSSELNSTINDSLHARANDTAALVAVSGGEPSDLGGAGIAGGRLAVSEEGFSQILSPGGRVVASTLSPREGSVLDPQEVRRAGQAPLFAGEREVPG